MFERILTRHIPAVTAAGFELKVVLFVLAFSISYLGQQIGYIIVSQNNGDITNHGANNTSLTTFGHISTVGENIIENA